MYTTFLEKDDWNDATSYYIELIEDAFKKTGQQVTRTKSIDEINRESIVFVVKITSMLRVLFKRPKQKIILWIQGITPEEALMPNEFKLKLYFRKFALRIIEWYVLPKALFIFMVSNEMLRHYQRIYNYKKSNHYIMPCFNQALNEWAFCIEKYEKPTFVYSGSLANWQCFTQTIQIYKQIEKAIPNSSLTILTKEQDKARIILEQYQISNYEVKYVHLTELSTELSKYKYGFLLREDIEINRVATPTKLNSYLAAGVIPIYSNVITDFREHLSSFKYLINIKNINDFVGCSRQIIQFEQSTTINYKDVLTEYKAIFSQYYNREYYVNSITNVLSLFK